MSWLLILRKRPALFAAFEGFEPERVASYGDAERARLLSDAGIIRNRRKIDAVIRNAGTILELRPQFGSFGDWLAAHHPLSKDEWVKLFRNTFTFTGGEITGEFLMSIGYLPGSHTPECPVFARLAALRPPWMAADR